MSLLFNPPEAQIFGGPNDRRQPSPIELLHISIFHSGPGIDELVNFYQVALNMRYVFRYTYPTFEFIAISNDDENHRIGFVNALTDAPPSGVVPKLPTMTLEDGTEPRLAPLRPCRIEHSSWLYRSFEDVLLTAKRIHDELGLWPRTARHGGIDLTMDYVDPDGNRVEMLSQSRTKAEILFRIHQQTMATGEDKRQYSDSYMSMNMEKLLGLYESGVPIPQLQDREYCRKLKEEGKL